MNYIINAPRIVHETIDDETIVIDFDSGTYYSAREVANRIWLWISAGFSVIQITDGIAREYGLAPEQIADVVAEFIASLIDHELILESAEPPSTRIAPLPQSSAPFSPPVLEKYSDMQELLLLDPIHEVGEQGWPHRSM
ncbi:PqqD family peptide modification chaperone [bacterium]|nr:PqqD family peptide modification chaperone [bacterium]